MDDLKNRIIYNNKIYRAGSPEISNTEYDLLLEQLKKLIKIDEYNSFIKGLFDESGKINHNYIIGSLNKAKSDTDQLNKWYTKFGIEYVTIMEKVDGCSIVLKYDNGNFIQAVTRGNGLRGIDQTDKFRYIIQQKLIKPFTGEIRAEATLTHESFEILKTIEPERDHKNLRNSTAGIINSKNVDIEKLKLIKVIAYQILGSDDNIHEQLQTLDCLCFDIVKYLYLIHFNIFDNEDLSGQLSDWKQQALYDIDGLVICDQDYSGENEYHPDKMIAFKVDDESEITTVKDVEWSVSKQGHMIPVLILEPVALNGTTVKRATVYNPKWMLDRNIGIGAEVLIIKSGEIIPKVIDVVTPIIEDFDITKFDCISCCNDVGWKGVHLYCDNPYCEDKNIKLVESFLNKMEVDGASATSLRNWGLVDFNELMQFTPNLSSKNQTKFYDELINKVFSASESKLFSCMYFEGAGRTTIMKLIIHFCLESLSLEMEKCEKDIKQTIIPGIKGTTWNKIRKNYFLNLIMVSDILNDDRYIAPEIIEKEIGTSILDKSFCFTGSISRPRREYETMVRDNGGTIKGVSKKLDYLVVGANAGSKLAKAEKLEKVTILTEAEFISMV